MASTIPRLKRFSLLLGILSCALPGTAVTQDEATQSELEALRDQVEQLSNLAVRTQSHVMVDVEYHFSNLWFAVHNQQWELASFYLRETDSHLRWTVRMRPIRSIRDTGNTVNLQPFLQAIEESGLAQLESAVENQNVDKFEAAYRMAMTECYACHQAAGLAYLQPHLPRMPLSPLMLE